MKQSRKQSPPRPRAFLNRRQTGTTDLYRAEAPDGQPLTCWTDICTAQAALVDWIFAPERDV